MPEELLATIVTDGIRRIHYFNGRVLTADDLRVEQENLHRRDDRLGRALGEGVVEGLTVHDAGTTPPAVTITAGVALTREGQVISLSREVTVHVLPAPEEANAGEAIFVPCPVASSGTAIPVGTGVYVLLAAPAAVGEGLAPRVGLTDGGVARSCETRFVVEGIRFRLAHLDLESDVLAPDAIRDELRALAAVTSPSTEQRGRLRSLLAHWCLGTVEIAGFPEAHFGAGPPPEGWIYGPLDRLRALEPGEPSRIAACEVPLALLFWQSGGIALLDRWSVRRRPAPPPASAPWAPHTGTRRMAEAEAAFLHFQEHLEEMGAAGLDPRAAAAEDLFAFLPPGGYVPAVEGSSGSFFANFPTFEEELDEALVRQHLFASWLEEPLLLLYGELPPLVLHRHDDYVLFRRGTLRVQAETETAPPEPEPEPEEPGTPPPSPKGRIHVIVEGSREAMRAFAQAFMRKEVRIEVEDTFTTDRYPVALSGKGDLGGRGGSIEDVIVDRFGRSPRLVFTTERVPTGRYRVSLRQRRARGREQIVDLAANETEEVTFALNGGPTKDPPRERPDRGTLVGPELDDRFGRYVFVEELFGELWPPREPEPEPWWIDPLDDPAPEVLEWATEWGRWMQTRYPDVAVDPENPLIFVNPGHDPESTPDSPYAYVAFGEHGAFAPLLVTAASRTLARDVAVEGTLLPGGALGRAADSSLGSLDALGAAWTGLVSDVLGVSESTATGLIADARTDVDARKGGLGVFSGVDAALEQQLVDAGFADAVALANAGAQALLDALGDQIGAAHARLLVEEARQVVPAGSWDLASSGLGFTNETLDQLEAEGVTTVGGFLAASQDPGRRDAVRTAVGVSEEVFGTIGEALEQQFSGASRELAVGGGTRVSVTGVGVDAESANLLAESGIRTVGDLADADRATVVEVLGEAAADVVLGRAKEALPVATMGGVSPDVARRLGAEGIGTVGALAFADPAELEGAFGDRASAEAAIGEARGRLGLG